MDLGLHGRDGRGVRLRMGLYLRRTHLRLRRNLRLSLRLHLRLSVHVHVRR
jgi:hypothetical protein